jgi:WD40 repeat protein
MSHHARCVNWKIEVRKERMIVFAPTNMRRWVTFDPTSRYIASAGQDKRIIVWDTRSGHTAHNISGTLIVDTVAVGSKWNFFYNTYILAHDDYINYVDFFPDGFKLASAANDQALKVYLCTRKTRTTSTSICKYKQYIDVGPSWERCPFVYFGGAHGPSVVR